MAKITRQTLQLFGVNGDTSNFGQFGSRAQFGSGNGVNTKTIPTIQSLTAWLEGWQSAINSANKAPFLEDMNSLFYVLAYMQVYAFQEGIAEYDAGTTYYQNSIVKLSGTLQLFGCAYTSSSGISGQAPVSGTSNTYWTYLGTLSDIAALRAIINNISALNGVLLCNGSGGFSAKTIGAGGAGNIPDSVGTGASGTWPINITGNAATATSAGSAGTSSHLSPAFAARTPLLSNVTTTGTYNGTVSHNGFLTLTIICPNSGSNASNAVLLINPGSGQIVLPAAVVAKEVSGANISANLQVITFPVMGGETWQVVTTVTNGSATINMWLTPIG
jgi:hypothetical protein